MSETKTTRLQTPVFTATKWDTAEDKTKAAAQLIAFIEAGYPRDKFTKRLYTTLSQHLFGHIAHFDLEGFYNVWFSTPKNQFQFIKHAVKSSSVGDPTYCWCDVERYIKAYIQNHNLLENAQTAHYAAIKLAERQQLATLLRRYGIPPTA